LKIHPNELLLEELSLAMGSERQRLLDHLIGCNRCKGHLRGLPNPRSEAGTGMIANSLRFSKASGDYGDSLKRSLLAAQVLELVIEKERKDAPCLYAELMEYPAGQREFLLRNAPRFHTWGLLELLLDRSWEMTIREPACSEDLARLSLFLAEHLDTSRYQEKLIEDLRARAWTYLANAHRLRSDLREAEAAFGIAYEHLKNGTREPLERALFLDLKASLRRDQRHFDEAVRLLQRATAIFLQDGDSHRAGRCLVNLSAVYFVAGTAEQSIPTLYQALDLIEPDHEPRLLLSAWHNLICALVDLGRFTEAHGLFRNARSIYRKFTDAWTQNRRLWVKGRILQGLGRPQIAESLLLAVREGFLAEGIPYDTALVSLDLAVLYAEQGRTAELKRLAGEMVPIFASRHIHREAMVALAFLKQALEAEKVSLEVVAGVASFLRRSQLDPALTFEPPA
jgi:tetratricopeptide (TPR) repeat protein